MNSTFSRTIALVVVLCMSLTAAQAAEVHLDGGQLIVAGVNDSIGLGGFDVVLSYGPDTSVTSVEPLSGFLVAENIRNDERMTIIAGISAEGLTGDIPVASVQVEGTGSITVSVRDLGNSRGDPIPFTNPEFTGAIPAPESSTSGNAPVGGSVTSAPTQVSLPTKTTGPAGTSQLTETKITPALTTEATTMETQVPPVASQETPEGGVKAESTPKAILPALVAFSAVFIVMVLKRKG
jgi:hypothetical protein